MTAYPWQPPPARKPRDAAAFLVVETSAGRRTESHPPKRASTRFREPGLAPRG